MRKNLLERLNFATSAYWNGADCSETVMSAMSGVDVRDVRKKGDDMVFIRPVLGSVGLDCGPIGIDKSKGVDGVRMLVKKAGQVLQEDKSVVGVYVHVEAEGEELYLGKRGHDLGVFSSDSLPANSRRWVGREFVVVDTALHPGLFPCESMSDQDLEKRLGIYQEHGGNISAGVVRRKQG
ncbi:hypothetical protein KKA02_01720 [Patescibacteria group bacterium]|nr:hypothetical protein [Patescibacteria group bacterium]